MSEQRERTFGGVRWVIIGMICMLTVINYIDRQTLSVLAPTIREAFGMTNVSYSRVVTMFLLGYTLSQAAVGASARSHRHASRVHAVRRDLDNRLDAAFDRRDRVRSSARSGSCSASARRGTGRARRRR